MFILNPRLAADIFDNEYIIANLDTGLYYSVQGLAVSLLQALPFEKPSEAMQRLAANFPPDAKSITEELENVWIQLVKDEIVKEPPYVVPVNGNWVPFTEYKPSQFNRYADMQDLLMLDPIHDVGEEGWTAKND